MTPSTSSDLLFEEEEKDKAKKKDEAKKKDDANNPNPSPNADITEGVDIEPPVEKKAGSAPIPNTEEPSGGYTGTEGIGVDDGNGDKNATEGSMHAANMGFFDKINKEGGGADYKVTFPPGPVGISLQKVRTKHATSTARMCRNRF